ncbi:hypothetical protein [Flavobacterium anhuiense]|uniref:hypothetical protein n=1 Tax=Flavobacterium anhuiense TaxID=459526 RepID=UPI002025C346|nr:hypothetical protein [Flavobacterium anhuiense]URM37353.1 hypothetical protein LLY39_01830 [Flavobacterium anhuiense]
MLNKDFLFFFPSTVFSGHEKMALKILEKLPKNVDCILNSKLESKFCLKNNSYLYINLYSLIKTLLKIRLRNSSVTIIIISGSPYGFLIEKVLIKTLLFELIDYVPFPELKIIEDRVHHRFVAFFNKLFVNKRILIDDWQVKYSAVKNCVVVKNIVEND